MEQHIASHAPSQKPLRRDNLLLYTEAKYIYLSPNKHPWNPHNVKLELKSRDETAVLQDFQNRGGPGARRFGRMQHFDVALKTEILVLQLLLQNLFSIDCLAIISILQVAAVAKVRIVTQLKIVQLAQYKRAAIPLRCKVRCDATTALQGTL